MFLFLCSKYMETRWIIWWILVHIFLKPTNNLKWLHHFIAHLWYQNFHTWSALYSHSSEAQQFQQVWHVPPCSHAWVIHDPFSYVYFPCVYSFFGEAPVQISAMVIYFFLSWVVHFVELQGCVISSGCNHVRYVVYRCSVLLLGLFPCLSSTILKGWERSTLLWSNFSSVLFGF